MWYYWDRVKFRSFRSKLRTVSAIGMEIKFGFARNSLAHSLDPQLGILISWKSPNQHNSESFGSWNSVFITVAEHRSSDKSRKERPTSWTIEIVRDDGFHRFQLGTHYMWCCLRYYIRSTYAVYMKSRTIKIRSQQKVLLLWVVAILLHVSKILVWICFVCHLVFSSKSAWNWELVSNFEHFRKYIVSKSERFFLHVQKLTSSPLKKPYNWMMACSITSDSDSWLW